MWTPTPDEQLKAEVQAALARPHASHVTPPRPVALSGGADAVENRKVVGWLWGQMRTGDGTWLGLATLWKGSFFDGAELDWYRAADLRTLD